ncbi:MAG: TraB/GumN family protein [Flavobacterium sp.]
MKKHLLHLFIWIFSIPYLFGQYNSNHLLWKISGNGLKKESFVYGTIHMTCNNELPAKVTSALNKAEKLVLEIKMDDPELMAKSMQGMQMKDGTRISSMVTAEQMELMNQFFMQHLGIPLKVLDQAKPALLQALFYSKMLDCSKATSVEQLLMNVAKSNDLEVLGLETIESQMAIFDQIPYQTQVEDLWQMVQNNQESEKSEFLELLELYQKEAIDAMITGMEKSKNKTSAEFKEILLDQRNQNWIAPMLQLMQEKSCLFGVGAAHLGGENGVLELLRKKGYQVTPVN